jgi:hypothetical protein
MKRAMSMLKNGNPSEDRSAYQRDLLAERLTDIATHHYVTLAMQHGIDQEPVAKEVYMQATGNVIESMPSIQHPVIEHFLATPDGRIAPDVGVEVKCPTSSKFIGWKLAGVVPDEHKLQMIAQCLCAGFREIEFIAFDPRMPAAQQLFVRRFVPTKEELAQVETAAVKFLSEVEAMFEAFTSTPSLDASSDMPAP